MAEHGALDDAHQKLSPPERGAGEIEYAGSSLTSQSAGAVMAGFQLGRRGQNQPISPMPAQHGGDVIPTEPKDRYLPKPIPVTKRGQEWPDRRAWKHVFDDCGSASMMLVTKHFAAIVPHSGHDRALVWLASTADSGR